MKREVTVESECIVENLDFPKYLDHAWLFIAAGIHQRLYRRTSNDHIVPGVVELTKQTSETEFELLVRGQHRWSDGSPILASEVARALHRGVAAKLFSAVDVSSNDRITLCTCTGALVGLELLASPLFTLTPSCRSGTTSTATCGPYVLLWCSKDKRKMTFRRRADMPSRAAKNSADRIHMLVTDDRKNGLRLLHSGHLTLTPPLGVDPDDFSRSKALNTIVNRPTNLAVVLRPYPDCWLCQDFGAIDLIARLLRRERLAEVTGQTFIPLYNFSQLFRTRISERTENCVTGNTIPSGDDLERLRSKFIAQPIEIRYADFNPNEQLAHDIKAQLESALHSPFVITATTYSEYVAGRFPSRCGLSLEIIQPALPEKYFRNQFRLIDLGAHGSPSLGSDCAHHLMIPLLQAMTTQISFDKRYSSSTILTNEALNDWLNL